MISSLQIPPHSEDFERAILGAMLLDPNQATGLLAERGVGGEIFYVPAHAKIFEVIMSLHGAGRPVDLLTVVNALVCAKMLDAIGGRVYLEGIMDETPTSAALGWYIEQTHEKYLMRRILAATSDLREKAFRAEATAAQLLAAAAAEWDDIANGVLRESRTNAQVLASQIETWERALETRRSGAEHLPGLHMPYRRMNEIMGGLQPGLHFVGGKSSTGKTSYVLNICYHLLLQGHAGLMIQLDDTHEDVIGRLVAMINGVSLPALAQGFAKQDQLAKIKRDEVINIMPLHVVEECENVKEAANLARYYKARHGIEWLVIDYVQVLDADGNHRDDERIRLGKIAAACKRLWKSLRIPVIVVSQVAKTKDSEDDGRRADMSDLFGASELFHAATTVTILKQIREKGEDRRLEPVTMPIDEYEYTKKCAVAGHVVKNKHGPKDCTAMFWANLKYFKFEETTWIKDKGIRRQRTWEEDIGGVGDPI